MAPRKSAAPDYLRQESATRDTQVLDNVSYNTLLESEPSSSLLFDANHVAIGTSQVCGLPLGDAPFCAAGASDTTHDAGRPPGSTPTC